MFKRVFFGELGLRSGWRCVFHSLGLGGVSVLCGILLLLTVVALESMGVGHAVESVPFLLGSYVLVVVCWMVWTGLSGKLMDGQGMTSAGIGGPLLVSAREFFEGGLVGVLLLIPALFIMALGSQFDVNLSAVNPWGVLNFFMLSTLLLFAATAEELVFRGYGFAWLCRSLSNGLEWLFHRLQWSPANAQRVAKHLGRAGPVMGVAVGWGTVALCT